MMLRVISYETKNSRGTSVIFHFIYFFLFNLNDHLCYVSVHVKRLFAALSLIAQFHMVILTS